MEMTITINSVVFAVNSTGAGKISQALVDTMNSSATFVELFNSISPDELKLKITIGAAGRALVGVSPQLGSSAPSLTLAQHANCAIRVTSDPN